MSPRGALFRYSSHSALFCEIAILAGILFSCLSPLHAQRPDPASAQAVSGWKAYEEGRLNNAKSLLEEAVRISPSVADFQAALAEVDAKLGQQDTAIQHFRRAILLKPSDTEFRLDLAQILQKKGNDQEALRVLQIAHPSPELSDAWHFSRGFSFFRLGKFAPASEEFKLLVQKPQFRASASFFLGNIAYTQGRFVEAE